MTLVQNNQNQSGHDYPITGIYAWGRSYVISARYLPGNTQTSTAGHRVFILPAGLNGLWSNTVLCCGKPGSQVLMMA